MTFRDDQWSQEFAALRRRIDELEAENKALIDWIATSKSAAKTEEQKGWLHAASVGEKLRALEASSSAEIQKLKDEIALLKRDPSQIQRDLDVAKKTINIMEQTIVVVAKGMDGIYSRTQVRNFLHEVADVLKTLPKI
jgi:chromosome segregation ATPase